MSADRTSAVTTARIWESFHADLRKYIQRRVGDPSTTEDLLQEVFLRIHRQLPQLQDDVRLSGWVYRITSNLITDHYRSRKPTLEPVELPAPPQEPDNINQEVGTWLRFMIETLPETYRDAVRMVEVEGLSQAEVAAQLGLSLSGAKSRVQRGRKQLRDTLDRCCHVEFDARGNALDYQPRADCC